MELTVISSNPTEKGNFCNKLQNKSEIVADSVFGQAKQERQSTYYLFTDKKNEVGMKGDLNLDAFDIIEKPYLIPDGENAGETVMLKTLYPKAG